MSDQNFYFNIGRIATALERIADAMTGQFTSDLPVSFPLPVPSFSETLFGPQDEPIILPFDGETIELPGPFEITPQPEVDILVEPEAKSPVDEVFGPFLPITRNRQPRDLTGFQVHDEDSDLGAVLKVRNEGVITYNAIAKTLQGRGILRQNGLPFHAPTVRNLLLDAGYPSPLTNSGMGQTRRSGRLPSPSPEPEPDLFEPRNPLPAPARQVDVTDQILNHATSQGSSAYDLLMTGVSPRIRQRILIHTELKNRLGRSPTAAEIDAEELASKLTGSAAS